MNEMKKWEKCFLQKQRLFDHLPLRQQEEEEEEKDDTEEEFHLRLFSLRFKIGPVETEVHVDP